MARFFASGGTVTTVGSDRVHKFTSSGNFVVEGSGTVKVLLVGAGGGSGGGWPEASYPGGGGGGEVEYNASSSVSAGTYSIVIGTGGTSRWGNAVGEGGDGGNTTFNSLSATGGKGARYYGVGGQSGSGYTGGPVGGPAGGGGAGNSGNGYAGSGQSPGGNGGPGTSSTILDDSTIYYGGGAGGGGSGAGGTGQHGGGNGGRWDGYASAPRENSGGGGSCDGTANYSGASGIVIIRYTPTYVSYEETGSVGIAISPVSLGAQSKAVGGSVSIVATPESPNMWYRGRQDVYTKLMIHANGSDASTTVIDEMGNTVSVAGSAQLVTAQKKFGTASLLLGGQGIDAYTSLLLHLDNNLTDSAASKTVTNSSATYTSQYPPAQSDTYVKATTYFNGNFNPWFATDPTKALSGAGEGRMWICANGTTTNQRFHIDLGSAKVIKRIYYENGVYTSGSTPELGVENFTFWGSNTAAAFAELTYGTDTNWTQITTAASTFDKHSAADAADPKYMTVTNTTAYRYYAFKFSDNYGYVNYMGINRVELQTLDEVTFSDSVKKFGTYSGYFNGKSYLTIPHSADWDFGTGAFTIDFWVNFTSFNSTDLGQFFFTERDDADNYFAIGYNTSNNGVSGTLYMNVGNGGDSFTIQDSQALSAGTWYHMAFVRSGNTAYVFVNGVNDTTASWTGKTMPNLAASAVIGKQDVGAGSYFFNGYIDELRVSKGFARWSSNFSVPLLPYSTGDYVSVPDGASWNFGAGDFTIDFWSRINCISDNQGTVCLYSQWTDADNYIVFKYTATTVYCYGAIGGTQWGTNNGYALAVDTWYHFAVVRYGNSGKYYINGSLVGSFDLTGITIPDMTSAFVIGMQGITGTSYCHNGWIDEFRISKGIARWTSNFDVPTDEYGAVIETGDVQLPIWPSSFYVQDKVASGVLEIGVLNTSSDIIRNKLAVADPVVVSGCPQCGTMLFNK